MFDDITELLDYCTDHDNVGQIEFKPKFVGRKIESMDDAKSKIYSEWTHGRSKYETIKDGVDKRVTMHSPRSIRRKRRFSEDCADDVCVDRLRGGDSRFWNEMHRADRSGPSDYVIAVNVATAGVTESSSIFYRSAAAIALADIMEQQGYRVRIEIIETGQNTYYAYKEDNDLLTMVDTLVAVTAKDFGQIADEGLLLNITSGWAFRTVWFGVLYNNRIKVDGANKIKVHYGLGQPTNVTADELDAALSLGSSRTMGVLTIGADVSCEDTAMARIDELVAEINEDQEV